MSSNEHFAAGAGRTALVLGVNGQDGSYLAERLVHNKWRVIGIGRQEAARPEIVRLIAQYRSLDLTDIDAFENLLEIYCPDVIFHAAAVHGAAGFDYETVWQSAHKVNMLSLHAALEYARRTGDKAQIIYFGSAKMFGQLDGRSISEASARSSSCIYSITKNAAADLVAYYRKRYCLDASVVWLFNHESPRRPDQYFMMKVLNALVRAVKNPSHKTTVMSLDFWCDWGHAKEYMQLIADGCDALRGKDIVLATGRTVWAREMISELFARYSLTVEDHILTQNHSDKSERTYWKADIGKFERLTKTKPLLTGLEVCEDILNNLGLSPHVIYDGSHDIY